MKYLTVFAIMLIAAFTVLPAHAGWYDYQHNTDNSLVWHDSLGESLTLKSGTRAGVEVANLSPATLWGLHKGDVILAVNGHAVKHVKELLQRLYASKPAAVALVVQRGNAKHTLTIIAADYTKIVNPQPPTQ